MTADGRSDAECAAATLRTLAKAWQALAGELEAIANGTADTEQIRLVAELAARLAPVADRIAVHAYTIRRGRIA